MRFFVKYSQTWKAWKEKDCEINYINRKFGLGGGILNITDNDNYFVLSLLSSLGLNFNGRKREKRGQAESEKFLKMSNVTSEQSERGTFTVFTKLVTFKVDLKWCIIDQ